MRIVIVGAAAGKSSLANTIFGETVFKIGHALNSETRKCQAETRSVSGRSITLIDTPGLFDTDRSDEELKPEIVRCITECAPGPHAFLIVLKVEKFTEHVQDVIRKMCQYFSEEAFKYATVVFTHGDQLPEDETIMDFVWQNKPVYDLVKWCGDRCHVVDSKYWQENPKHEYRSNQYQVEELLKTIEKMVEDNNGECYTNEILQRVEREIQQEKRQLRLWSEHMPEEVINERAKMSVFRRLLMTLVDIAAGALWHTVTGITAAVGTLMGYFSLEGETQAGRNETQSDDEEFCIIDHPQTSND